MDKQLLQRAGESAERMTRAGLTLSAGIMEELLAAVQRLEAENASAADYIHFLEQELLGSQTTVEPGPEPVLSTGARSNACTGAETRKREPAPAEIHSTTKPIGNCVKPAAGVVSAAPSFLREDGRARIDSGRA